VKLGGADVSLAFMSNDERVFCLTCGEPLKLWNDADLPYERWLDRACVTCGTRPTRYQDSEIVLAHPIAAPLGAVALAFEQVATALRMSIFMLCFDSAHEKTDVCDAMLSPLSYAEQIRVFSAVFLTRFPHLDAEAKRMRRRLERSGEARNRALHSSWMPARSLTDTETGMRFNTTISAGKLRKDAEEVSMLELTHLAMYLSKLYSDLLIFTMKALDRLPWNEAGANGP
jgi:hypothetical protein